MKKILPLFLAMASLGLMAATAIDVSSISGQVTYSSGDEFSISGVNLFDEGCSLKFLCSCTIELNSCNFHDNPNGSDGAAIIIGDSDNNVTVTMKAGANSWIGGDSYACISIAAGSKLILTRDIGETAQIGLSAYDGVCLLNKGEVSIEGANLDPNDASLISNDNTGTITISKTTLTKDEGFVYVNGGSCKIDASSSICGQLKNNANNPTGYNDKTAYRATIPNACPSSGIAYNYIIKANNDTVGEYIGPGHGSTEAYTKALYFYLPNGTYTVEGHGKVYVGTIDDGPSTFALVPEPCFGLVCLLGLCFLRRK